MDRQKISSYFYIKFLGGPKNVLHPFARKLLEIPGFFEGQNVLYPAALCGEVEAQKYLN